MHVARNPDCTRWEQGLWQTASLVNTLLKGYFTVFTPQTGIVVLSVIYLGQQCHVNKTSHSTSSLSMRLNAINSLKCRWIAANKYLDPHRRKTISLQQSRICRFHIQTYHFGLKFVFATWKTISQPLAYHWNSLWSTGLQQHRAHTCTHILLLYFKACFDALNFTSVLFQMYRRARLMSKP